MKKGVLLVNLGTPEQPTVSAVRKYLKQFLLDRRVVSLPSVARKLLVYGIILPFRPYKTVKKYQKIWTENGSPLLAHSKLCAKLLAEKTSEHTNIVLGMRYGEPSLKSAIQLLNHVDELIVIPLFPQYASATTGSIIEYIFNELKQENIFPNIRIIRDFYTNPQFIRAQTQIIQEHIRPTDHLLLSYHGLPERQLKQTGCPCDLDAKNRCLFPSSLTACYRRQCIETTDLIKKELHRTHGTITMAFQSRLGKTPWIKPYTDDSLRILRQKGIKDLAICCPSFVADCLETLEEIGLEAKALWSELGGNRFTLIPCVNTHQLWIDALCAMIESIPNGSENACF